MATGSHLLSLPMEPKLLWRPSAERAERATIARFARARRSRGRLRRAVALVGRRPRGASGPRSGSSSTCRPPSRTSACSGAARCPARSGSRGRGCPTPSTSSAIATTTRWPSATPASCASSSQWTWGELREQTARIAAGLRRMGVGPGDRVAAYMPNIPETVAAFLATASIGAVWSSAAPEFGARSVVDRFAQIEPKVLLAVDGYRYGGRDHDRGEVVAGIAEEIGAQGRALRLPRRRRLAGGARGRRRAADLRAGAVRPPAVAALQLGHHRACPSRSSTARAGSCSST